MTQAGSSFQPNTFQDILSLLTPGSRLVVCLPTIVDSRLFHQPILRSFKNAKRVVVFSSEHSTSPPNIPSTKKPSDTIVAMRKVFAKHKTPGSVLVESSSGLGKWYSQEKHRQIYIQALLDLISKKGITGVVQIVESDYSQKELVKLKDAAEFFLHIRKHEGQYIGQLLEAKSTFSPDALLPFVINPNHTSGPPLPFIPIQLQVSQSPATKAPPSYQQVFDAAPEPMLRIHQTSGRVEANARALSLLGRTAEEVNSLSLTDSIASGKQFGVLRMLIALRRKTRVVGETTLRRKDGRTLTVALNATRISDEELVVTINDISEARKKERLLLENVDQYRIMVEQSPFPVVVFAKRKSVLLNHAFGQTFPWLKQVGFSPGDLFARTNHSIVKDIGLLSENGENSEVARRYEATIRDQEGAGRIFDVSALSIPYKSGSAVLCSFVEITEARAHAGKLFADQEYYRRLLDEAAEAVSLAQDGQFTYVNRRFVEVFGYESAEELIGKPSDFLRVGRSHEPEYKKPTSGKKPEVYSFEYEGKKKDGTRLSIEAQSIGLTFNDAPTIVTYHRDVTERKAAEELSRRTTQAVTLTQRIIASSASLDLSEALDSSMSALTKALGMDFGGAYVAQSLKEPLVLTHAQSVPDGLLGPLGSQDASEGIMGFVIKTQEPLVLLITNYPPFLPYKSLFESQQVPTIVYLPLVHNAHVVAILFLGSAKAKTLTAIQTSTLEMLKEQLGAVIDNARTYTALKQAEELYRSSVENISDVIYQVSAHGTLSFISPNVERLLGYKPQEFHRSADLWRTIIHPDDRANYSQRISQQSHGIDDFHIDYRMLPKGKATYRWIRDSIRYKRGEKEQLLSINGILSDITDRIDLEAALIKSEELKTNVLESVQEGVMVMDSTFAYIDWNNAMEDITGIARDQVIGQGAFQRTPQLVNERVRPFLSRALAGEAVSSEDITITTPGHAESRSIWIRYSPLRDSSGAIRGIVGIVTDISNRKKLELEIRESEETLRNVIDAMGDALMISDLQGRVWEINREFSRVTGYPRNEVLGVDFPYPWVLDEEMSMFVKWIAALREKNYLRDFDMTWRRKDGHMVAISLNTTMLRNAFGEPVAMLNIGRDITDRRRLSLELEHKNKQIELLNRIISKANTTMDFEEIFDTIAKEVFSLVPFDQINVGLISDAGASMTVYACTSPTGINVPVGSVIKIEKTVSRLAILQGKPVVINDLATEPGIDAETSSIVEGLQSQIAVPFYLHDRVLGTFCVASVHKNAFTGDELDVLQPIADQIGAMVDRVRLFQKVSDDSAYIHNLVNSIDSVVFTVDPAYRITEANKAWRDFAAEQGLELFSNETAIIGRPLEEIMGGRPIWNTLKSAMGDLFERRRDFYAQEFELDRPSIQRTYHLTINPMIINDRVTGLVFTFTDITAIKRTEEEVRQRNKELVALNAIGNSISTSLKLGDVLRVAAEQIREIVNADLVLFYLHDSSRDELFLSHSLGISATMSETIKRLPVSSSATGSVIASRKPLYVRNSLKNDPRVTVSGREMFSVLNINSLAAIPLQSKENVLGAMDVGFSIPHEFSAQEQQLLLLIGNQIGAAIENAQLYSEVEAQVTRITSLYELGKHLSGALDTQTLLESVHSEISRVFPIDRFCYLTFNAERHSITTAFEAAGHSISSGEGTSPNGETVVTDESDISDAIVSGTSIRRTGLEGKGGENSRLVVPVKSKQQLIGFLMMEAQGTDIYSEAHLRLLESIANLTEIALERASLYEDTINKSMEIEARNKELDDFTYVVSHDLKEPLISIEGYSKILLKDYKDKIDDEAREYLSSVVQSSARMKSLIDDLLTLSRLGRVTEALHTVSVGLLIKEILHDLRFLLQEKQVSVTVPDGLPEVRYNATQLSMVFRNLISNALKFNNKPSPTIVIEMKEEDAYYVFSVADDGIGIDEQYYDKIFMIFQRLQRNEEYRGTGAGLTIVKKIVEKHHGRIWVDSIVGKGSKFYFTVPK